MIFSLACIQPRNKWKIIIPSFKHKQSYNNSALIDSMRAHRSRNNKGHTVKRESTYRKIDSYSNSHLISSHRKKIAKQKASEGLFNSLFKTSDDEFKKIYKEMDNKLYDCEELLNINKATVLVQNKEISTFNEDLNNFSKENIALKKEIAKLEKQLNKLQKLEEKRADQYEYKINNLKELIKIISSEIN